MRKPAVMLTRMWLLLLLTLGCGCGSASESDPSPRGAAAPVGPDATVVNGQNAGAAGPAGDAGPARDTGSAVEHRAAETEASAPDAGSASDASSLPERASCEPRDCAIGEPAGWDVCVTLAQRAGVSLANDAGIGWARLLCETVDLDRFTRAPASSYRAKLASSYDRSARSEGDNGWFSNGDRGTYLRSEGDEHVMMESFGPGVITRLWTPNPSGLLRIYIDDAKTPVLELPMGELLSGRHGAPWSEPLVFVAAEGYSSYLPIPFARYARVATTTSESLYYQVHFREYPADTEVQPYSSAGLEALVPLVRELGRFLAEPWDTALRGTLAQHELRLSDSVPEQRVALGPAVIRELVITGFDPSEEWLRKTRLILTVDGERTVDAPVGDLFGSGPGLFPHASLGLNMAKEALTLRWPMPVRGELHARVESNGGAIGELALRLRTSRGVPEPYHLFHALWTGPRNFETFSPSDWTLFHFRGAGWYVGTALNVTNPTWWWWGEGDEKVFVDGEAFPSLFGTGTEDYFGFGWCSNELFARPWVGQTRADGPLNHGRSSQYRWHVGDPIPFQRELRLNLEVAHWVSGLFSVALTQDAMAYWYARPGGTSAVEPLALDAFRIPVLPPPDAVIPPGAYTCRM